MTVSTRGFLSARLSEKMLGVFLEVYNEPVLSRLSSLSLILGDQSR